MAYAVARTGISVHGADAGIEQLLDRWTALGFITPEQAERIRRDEGQRQDRTSAMAMAHVSSRGPLIAEALGYLGGVLIVVAASLFTQWYWADLGTWARLALPAAAATLLFLAGWVVYRQRSARTGRLRAVLWLGSTAALAFALWVVGRYALNWSDEDDIALLVGLGSALFAAILWWLHRTFVQQLALFAALVVTVVSAAARLERVDSAPGGLAISGLGLVWLALGWGGLLQPRRAVYALGATAFLVGAMVTMPAGDWGYVFALITSAALVSLAIMLSDLLLLGIAAVGALVVLPASVTHFFPGALAAPLALLVTGILLVLAALRTTRRRSRLPTARRTERRTADRSTAIALACGAALVATLGALIVGLTE